MCRIAIECRRRPELRPSRLWEGERRQTFACASRSQRQTSCLPKTLGAADALPVDHGPVIGFPSRLPHTADHGPHPEGCMSHPSPENMNHFDLGLEDDTRLQHVAPHLIPSMTKALPIVNGGCSTDSCCLENGSLPRSPEYSVSLRPLVHFPVNPHIGGRSAVSPALSNGTGSGTAVNEPHSKSTTVNLGDSPGLP